MEQTNDLADFMLNVSREMQSEYVRIQKRSAEDPGTAGDQGEENWAEVFKNWLPAGYHVVTKGRILGVSGAASGQVDVIVLKPSYPPALLSKKLYLASEVAAAFECKITLRSEDIGKAMANSIAIKNLHIDRKGTYQAEMYSPIIYGVLAHSHEWKKPGSTPRDNISETLIKVDNNLVTHPYGQLDLLCVSDLACWSVVKSPFSVDMDNDTSTYQLTPGPTSGYGITAKELYSPGYHKHDAFTAIGVMLAKLLKRLSMFDSTLVNLSNYFSTVLSGLTQYNLRVWPEDILTETARKELTLHPHEEYSRFVRYH